MKYTSCVCQGLASEALPSLGICEKHGLSSPVQMYGINLQLYKLTLLKELYRKVTRIVQELPCALYPLPLTLTPYIIRYPHENQKLNIVTVPLAEMWTLLNFISFLLMSFFCFRI